MHVVFRVGWCLVVVDLIAAASLFFAQDSGDAATRGIGQGFGAALGLIAVAAAALLFWGARGEGRGLALVLGWAIAAAPVAMTVAHFSRFTTTHPRDGTKPAIRLP